MSAYYLAAAATHHAKNNVAGLLAWKLKILVVAGKSRRNGMAPAHAMVFISHTKNGIKNWMILQSTIIFVLSVGSVFVSWLLCSYSGWVEAITPARRTSADTSHPYFAYKAVVPCGPARTVPCQDGTALGHFETCVMT